jgi:hypothetical protein
LAHDNSAGSLAIDVGIEKVKLDAVTRPKESCLTLCNETRPANYAVLLRLLIAGDNVLKVRVAKLRE